MPTLLHNMTIWHKEWLVEDDPLYLKLWAKLTAFLRNLWFSIDFHS